MELTTSTGMISAIDLINLSNDLASVNAVYLGISVTILIILGGVFIYFNFNPLREKLDKQEEKIGKLKEEASGILVETRDEVASSIDSFRFENEKNLSKTLENEFKKQSLEIDNNLAKIDKFLSEKIERLTKTQVSSMLETNKSLSSLESNAKDMQFEIKGLMAFRYQQEGKMGGITYPIELLQDLIKNKGCKNHRIQYILKDLRDRIKGTSLDEKYIQQIKEILKKLREGGFEDPEDLIKQVEDNIRWKRDVKDKDSDD